MPSSSAGDEFDEDVTKESPRGVDEVFAINMIVDSTDYAIF
jgi:hypothetical protein